MATEALENTIKVRREQAALSQRALAEQIGITRQGLIAIEAGRQVPSTAIALRLAATLGCRVEDLFRLPSRGLSARWAGERETGRVAVGRVAGRWVAHPLDPRHPGAADGLVAGGESAEVEVEPLADPAALARNVLVAGCAPPLGLLADRLGRRVADARMTWLSASSGRALDLLAAGLVHVAGLHHEQNHEAVQARFPGRRMLVVSLVGWREGLLVPAGNPAGIRSLDDLRRPGLRFAHREAGAGARRLLERALGDALPAGPCLPGHLEVAQAVALGAADAGIAIEPAASAFGLGFVALAEERFDLALPAEVADEPSVAGLLEAIDDAGYRREVASLGAYDTRCTGHVVTLEAA